MTLQPGDYVRSSGNTKYFYRVVTISSKVIGLEVVGESEQYSGSFEGGLTKMTELEVLEAKLNGNRLPETRR